MKRGHSGSTWLSTLLLKLPLTFFVDEAVPGGTICKGSEFADYLIEALQRPVGKFFSKDEIWTDQHYDGEQTKKCYFDKTCHLEGIGMSVAPFAGEDKNVLRPHFYRDLTSVMTAVPQTRLILLLRTNIVKMARAFNGNKHALDGDYHAKLDDRAKSNWSKNTFVASCIWNMEMNRGLITVAEKDYSSTNSNSGIKKSSISSTGRPLIVYYEALQLDLATQMDRVRVHLGFPSLGSAAPPDGGSGSIKRSSEDLRDTVANFHDLEKFLKRNATPAATCYLAMLQARGPEVFAVPCTADWG